MGKGRIITDHGEGLYTIELLEDRVRAEASRTLAEQRVASLDDRIADLEADFTAAQSEVDSAAEAQDQAIAAYQADPTDDNRAAMVAAGPAVIQASATRDAIAGNIRSLKVERLALQRRIDRIDALPALRQQQAWCGDLTESLAGEVGTAEVPGQAQQVLVHPGFEGAAVYDQARDGALQPALSGTPASVYYNLAMLPGWQKWRPTYRIATITSLSTSTDSCDIDIAPATSSEQGLNVNAEASYAGVPIQYMTCHANAFEVGDRVLVRFDRQDQSPTVIGFESEPRGCGIDTIVAAPITLFYNDILPFLIGSECACFEPSPTAGKVYSGRNVDDYVWGIMFREEVKVFGEEKMEQVLSASDYSGWPAPDSTTSAPGRENDVTSLYRSPTKYDYSFPIVNQPEGTCDYQTDSFSRLAVTNENPEVGGGDKFFNGELEMRATGDPEDYKSLAINGTSYQYSVNPVVDQKEWESAEHGVFTTADDGQGRCSALFLLSKEKAPTPALDVGLALGVEGSPSSQRQIPDLTIDGKNKRPLGIFGIVDGENVFSLDDDYFDIGLTRRWFNNQHQRRYYLLIGYGR